MLKLCCVLGAIAAVGLGIAAVMLKDQSELQSGEETSN
jgi:hypothetical protein